MYSINIIIIRGKDSSQVIFIASRRYTHTHKLNGSILIKRRHEKRGLTADLITECRAESILKTQL